MKALLWISKQIDRISYVAGLVAVWLVLLAALVSAFNALARYSVGTLVYLGHNAAFLAPVSNWLFDLYRSNSNTLSDLQLAMFSGMVMLGAAWTLKMNEHVRVDLVYSNVTPRARLWMDLIGVILFLIPMCVLMMYFTWPWFLQSWQQDEMSANAGGLPRWPAKLMLPLGFALVLLQGISEAIKCVLALTTDYKREHHYEKPVQ